MKKGIKMIPHARNVLKKPIDDSNVFCRWRKESEW